MDNNNNMNDKRKNDMNRRPKPGAGLLFYVILAALILFSSTFFFGDTFSSGSESKTLSDILYYIDSDSYDVSSVNVDGTTVTVTYKDATGMELKQTQSIPYEYVDDLIVKLEQAKLDGKLNDYNYTEPVDWAAIVNIVTTIGMIILVLVIFLNLSKQGKDGNSVFSFGSNKARLTSPKDMKVKFADVAGSKEEKEELSEIVDFLKAPKKYHDLGAKIPKGVILYGAPGTGKTLLARAVAGEAGVPFFYISGSDFVEMLVGAGASRVRSLFADAKKAAPAVIFIDEIDAVGRKRGAGLGGGNDEREQTLNQILVEMDGFEKNTNVIVIAATNRADVLDPALLRPGRFDRKVMVNEPDADEREAILKIHAKGKPLAKDVNLREIALSTSGFTGADLANLLNEAALLTARRNKKEISPLEISDATFRVMMGPEKSSKKLSDKVKRLTAYHEAGHAIVLKATSDNQKVDRVTIIPSGRAGGFTAYKPVEDIEYYTEKMLLDSIKTSLGGRAAEEIFLGEISTGASSDLQHCNRVASAMVKKYGLSPKFPNMVFGDENNEVFVGASFGQVQPYSDATATEIDKEIQRIINECYDDVKRILTEKSSTVIGLSERLIEVLKVDSPEFEEIYANNGDLTAIRAREAVNKAKPETDAPAAETSATDAAASTEEAGDSSKNSSSVVFDFEKDKEEPKE